MENKNYNNEPKTKFPQFRAPRGLGQKAIKFYKDSAVVFALGLLALIFLANARPSYAALKPTTNNITQKD